jgi:hypothetical protein
MTTLTSTTTTTTITEQPKTHDWDNWCDDVVNCKTCETRKKEYFLCLIRNSTEQSLEIIANTMFKLMADVRQLDKKYQTLGADINKRFDALEKKIDTVQIALSTSAPAAPAAAPAETTTTLSFAAYPRNKHRVYDDD